MGLTVTAEPWGSADGSALRAMQRRGLDERYGSGAATAALRALEAEACALGFDELKLETGGTAQPEAMRFYQREGYGLIANFGVYPGEPLSVCYARSL